MRGPKKGRGLPKWEEACLHNTTPCFHSNHTVFATDTTTPYTANNPQTPRVCPEQRERPPTMSSTQPKHFSQHHHHNNFPNATIITVQFPRTPQSKHFLTVVLNRAERCEIYKCALFCGGIGMCVTGDHLFVISATCPLLSCSYVSDHHRPFSVMWKALCSDTCCLNANQTVCTSCDLVLCLQ